MLSLKEKMKENIKKLVEYCRNRGVASIATDISEFDWYVTRKASLYEALIPKDAIRVEKGIVEEIKEVGLEIIIIPGQSSFFLVRA